MRWVTGVLALTVAVSAEAQQAQPPQALEVTLPEAIQRSLLVQPTMVRARGGQRNAGAQRRAAYGAFLPSLRLSSSAIRQTDSSIVNGFPVGPGDFTFNSSLTADLDLFAGFRRLARRASAQASVNAAEAGVINERFQVTLLTRQAFYDALASEELVRVAQSQVRRAQQQLQISVEKLRAGSATRSDSLRSTVDYGNARIALLEAQANLAADQATLGRQIGVDQPVRAVPDSALPAPPDTAALRALAIEGMPQVEQADAEARAARASIWDARSPYLPTFSVSWRTSSQGITKPWDGFESNRNLNSLTFGLSWTIFNGFAREQEQVSAAVTRDNAEAAAADTRRRVNAQLSQQIAALATAYEKISIAQANVAAATEDVRVQNERYRVGAATILDLLTSQASLTQAEQNIVRVRFDYLIARAQLEALVGRQL
jgi:outer membrane protein TolC